MIRLQDFMVFKDVYELYFRWINNSAYFKLKNLYLHTIYCHSFENFNPANEVNFSISKHKKIIKPVYTTYGIQLLLQFQILIYIDP